MTKEPAKLPEEEAKRLPKESDTVEPKPAVPRAQPDVVYGEPLEE